MTVDEDCFEDCYEDWCEDDEDDSEENSTWILKSLSVGKAMASKERWMKIC